MAVYSRNILDLLRRPTLVRLMRQRGLPRSRENEGRRKSLAHSYRGDVESLVMSLTRQELVAVFRKITFEQRSAEVYLANPGKYHWDELQAFAIRAFAGRPVRIPGEFTPVDNEEDDDEDDGWDDTEDLEDGDEEDLGDDEGVDPDVENDEEVPTARLLHVHSSDWSRPRMIARVLRQLGEEVPQRLRSTRFQELIEMLAQAGVEACYADDPSACVLSASDDSPGINAKLRLRMSTGPGGQRLAARAAGRRSKAANEDTQPPDGGPRIVLEAGEKPIPQQVARPSDYNLAVLRLQFLTAVPSAERGSLSGWPEGYLLAATRGLSLREQERSLLRAYAVGLRIGNHSPYDAIPRLSQALSPSEWDALLDDFQALNPFQPELVQAIIDQVTPVTAPRSQPGSWRKSAPPAPADLASTAQPLTIPLPLAASSRRRDPSGVDSEPDASNKRDLGALADMFDDE